MSKTTHRVLSEALIHMFRPLIRILLRNGVTFRAFSEIAKAIYVEVAAEEFPIPGRKQTDSRIAVITGLSRKEVKRVRSTELSTDPDNLVRFNRAARVISGWTQDPDFIDANGSPRDLQLEGEGATFAELVRRYSGDAPPRAVLDELERVGTVERHGDNTLVLLTRAYIPQTDNSDKVGVLGIAVGNLLQTVDHNIWGKDGDPYFQRILVSNGALSTRDTDEFRQLTKQAGQRMLENLDHWLGEHERPSDQAGNQPDGGRVGVGIYYFQIED